MSKIILTGDRPTGRLHVGHYVGSPVKIILLMFLLLLYIPSIICHQSFIVNQRRRLFFANSVCELQLFCKN